MYSNLRIFIFQKSIHKETVLFLENVCQYVLDILTL